MSHPTVAHAFAALMNGHDPDAVDGFVAEEYVNHNPYVEDGREANRAFWGRWFAAFPDTRVTLEDVLTDGDRVVGRFTYRATHLGSLLGEEPTGRAVEMRSLDIWRVRDGMAVEHWDELNTLEFFTQLGLLAPMGMPDTPADSDSGSGSDTDFDTPTDTPAGAQNPAESRAL